MALVILPQPVNVAFGTFSFFMGDAKKRTVRVDVSKELLARLDGPPPQNKQDYIDRLIHHQYLFAHIAARKYLAGESVREVCVFVVHITCQDLDAARLINLAEADPQLAAEPA